MSKPLWSIEQKKQHVAAWCASGLTRLQYVEPHDIPFTSLRECPKDVANLSSKGQHAQQAKTGLLEQ